MSYIIVTLLVLVLGAPACYALAKFLVNGEKREFDDNSTEY